MKKCEIDLAPPGDRSEEYGLELYNLYHETGTGFWQLFKCGLTGLVLGEDAPVDFKQLSDISASIVALPEGNDFDSGEIPRISGGNKLQCVFTNKGNVYPRHYERVLLRGTLSSLLSSEEEEGTGEAAVALCASLARAGYMPVKRDGKDGLPRPAFILEDVTLLAAGTDMLVEIALFARKYSVSDFPLPVNAEGDFDIVNVMALTALSQERK